MPRWDYFCTTCGRLEEREFARLMDAPDIVTCHRCDGSCVRQPAASNFTVKGFNAANGYSGSAKSKE